MSPDWIFFESSFCGINVVPCIRIHERQVLVADSNDWSVSTVELGHRLHMPTSSESKDERYTAENPCLGTWKTRKRVEVESVYDKSHEVLSIDLARIKANQKSKTG